MIPNDTPNGTPVLLLHADEDPVERVYIGADPDDPERFYMRAVNLQAESRVTISVRRDEYDILPTVSEIRSVGYHLYSDGSGSIDVFVKVSGFRADNVTPYKASLNRDGTWGRFDFRDREMREANPQGAVIDADIRGSLAAHERFGPLARHLGLVP